MTTQNNIGLEKEIEGVGRLYHYGAPFYETVESLGTERMLRLKDLAEIIIQNKIEFRDSIKFSYVVRERIIRNEDGFLLVRDLPISYLKNNELTNEDHKKIVREYSELAKEDAKKPVEERRVLEVEDSTQTFKPTEFKSEWEYRPGITSWAFGDKARALGENLLYRSFYHTCSDRKGRVDKERANKNCSFIFCPEVERLGQLKLSFDYKKNVREANWFSTNMAAFMGYESISYFPTLTMKSTELTRENLEGTVTRFLIREGDEEGLRKIKEIMHLSSVPDEIEQNKFYSPKEINLYMKAKRLKIK